MKILFLKQIAILKAQHSRILQSFSGNMTELPSNDEITQFDSIGNADQLNIAKKANFFISVHFTALCLLVENRTWIWIQN
jgi:hypothetical protein